MTAPAKPSTIIGADLHDIQYGHRRHRHWHYIYKKRRKKAEAISSRQIMFGQIIALCGSLVAGYVLEINKEHIVAFTGALLLLPGIIDLAASITGAMCAKINHKLESDRHVFKVLYSSVAFSIFLTIFSGFVVGLTGGLIGEIFFDATFWKILVLCQSSMLIVGLVAYPLMAGITALVKKSGYDPDNIVGPVETGFTDALMVMTVSLIVRLLV